MASEDDKLNGLIADHNDDDEEGKSNEEEPKVKDDEEMKADTE